MDEIFQLLQIQHYLSTAFLFELDPKCYVSEADLKYLKLHLSAPKELEVAATWVLTFGQIPTVVQVAAMRALTYAMVEQVAAVRALTCARAKQVVALRALRND
jgi:hypothetical protein